MSSFQEIVAFLKEHDLTLATAESCTAGRILEVLASVAGSGQCLDVGFVVYSKEAKIKLLDVKPSTIEQFTLTSEEVVREMALGAFKKSSANVVLATTGLAGDEPIDGIPPGTICIAWGFKNKQSVKVYTKTCHFSGTRRQVQIQAAKYAVSNIPLYHKKFLLN